MSTHLSASDFAPLFGLAANSPEINSFLSSLPSSSSSTSSTSATRAEIKSYPDAEYHNYYSLGISLCFIPHKGLDSIDFFNPSPFPIPTPTLGSRAKDQPTYSAPPPLQFTFPGDTIILPPRKEGESSQSISRPTKLDVQAKTSGREFVACFGEPSRKSSGGWTGLWLEWADVELVRESRSTAPSADDADENARKDADHEGKAPRKTVKIGVMLELRDPGANEVPDEQSRKEGMGGVWERAARWEWKSVKLFKP